jgi:hypothetical protein
MKMYHLRYELLFVHTKEKNLLIFLEEKTNKNENDEFISVLNAFVNISVEGYEHKNLQVCCW